MFDKFIDVNPKLVFITILVVAVALRVFGLNWDQGQHLHPDERFLTMVAMAEKIPNSFSNYLDPTKSTLNPYNVGYNFFVYGTLPLTITKLAAVLTNLDNYTDFTVLGRLLSALVDVGTLVTIFFLVRLWETKYRLDKRIKYWA